MKEERIIVIRRLFLIFGVLFLVAVHSLTLQRLYGAYVLPHVRLPIVWGVDFSFVDLELPYLLLFVLLGAILGPLLGEAKPYQWSLFAGLCVAFLRSLTVHFLYPNWTGFAEQAMFLLCTFVLPPLFFPLGTWIGGRIRK